jgi:hypothetical protein
MQGSTKSSLVCNCYTKLCTLDIVNTCAMSIVKSNISTYQTINIEKVHSELYNVYHDS